MEVVLEEVNWQQWVGLLSVWLFKQTNKQRHKGWERDDGMLLNEDGYNII